MARTRPAGPGRAGRRPGGRGSYPQVDFRARGLMTDAVVTGPATLSIAEAEGLLRRRQARVLVAPCGPRWGVVVPATLARARSLGLADHPVRVILWLAPVVAPGASEVDARRAGGPTEPIVVVAEGRRVTGAILREAPARALPASAARHLAALPSDLQLRLRAAGKAGEARGWPVAAVGGFARDLLRGAPGTGGDLDLVVEGDATSLAQDLAGRLGGEVRTHEAFLTATVTLRDRTRIDVATARSERYPRPGALPDVVPGDLRRDLARRDFSVNALAIRLDGAAWGDLLDPHGGLTDLRQRRLRVLHPLSFVEDPTRAFRAARFAARLGAGLDAATRRLLDGAVRLGAFPALSGDRLRREVRLALAEPAAGAALEGLATTGALHLLVPRWIEGPAAGAAGRRLRNLPARLEGLRLAGGVAEALVALAGVAHLGEPAVEHALARLALPPAVRAAGLHALREAPGLAARLAAVRDPAEAYPLLHARPEPTLAWALLTARGPARRWLTAHLGGWRDQKPLLSGDDLLALGVGRGPEVGRRLDALLAAQAAGRITTRTQALRWARAPGLRGTPTEKKGG